MSNNEEKSPKVAGPQWKKIITDFLLLITVTGFFGIICKEVMDELKPPSPFGNIVSIVNKDDIVDKDDIEDKDDKDAIKNIGTNPYFIKELNDKYKKNVDFANEQDNHGATLLMKLSYSNNNATKNNELADITRVYYIQQLIGRAGINPNLTDLDGFNALHWATWSGLTRISTILINAGIDINLQENNGYTPLMLAAMRGNEKVVTLLLGLGADPSLKNNKGQTAAELAKRFTASYSQRDSYIFKLIYDKERHAASVTTSQHFQADQAGKLLELPVLMAKIIKEDEAQSREEAKKIAKKGTLTPKK